MIGGGEILSAKHAAIVLTDLHLNGTRNDLEYFHRYCSTIRHHADSLEKLGYSVHTLSLGDIGEGLNWNKTRLTPDSLLKIITKAGLPTPFHTAIGNHDFTADCETDSTAAKAAIEFEKSFGKRFYSFDIENAHYIVLDNIRGRKQTFSNEELDWLEQDLSNIDRDAMLLISMHAPIHSYIKGTRKIRVNGDLESTNRLLRILQPFSKVMLLSGHTHRNGLVRVRNGANELIDLNLVSTSGTLWWNTEYRQPNLGHDGNPAGFEIITIDETETKWQFIPYEYPSDQAFKVWSGNQLKEYFSKNSDVQKLLAHLPKWGKYESLPDNAVLVQVWGWDPAGELTILEGTKKLPVNEIYEVHPDYYATTAIQKSVGMNDFRKSLGEPRKARFLMSVASSPDAKLTITWTTPFGKSTQSQIQLDKTKFNN